MSVPHPFSTLQRNGMSFVFVFSLLLSAMLLKGVRLHVHVCVCACVYSLMAVTKLEVHNHVWPIGGGDVEGHVYLC